jgi:hypothetical protein
MDPHQRESLGMSVTFDDLVRDSDESPAHIVAVEHDAFVSHGSFLVSRDRVKGAR